MLTSKADQENTEKSKEFSGTAGLRSHNRRVEKIEMRLYRCVWFLVPRLNLIIDYEK